ncbi:DUF6510 family protein [Rugosimonospora africana]|uniref:Uncharacterized protein n=1 Tax=Rugosimonospora africana TaxID=556532 RepID=A0A8J3R3C6_9ACTN|nr:DUF6510 family protein [Rugosimonospora africana]GIH21526.1 hypothetical protein Raf01_96980 [Rugosimonospora africana]
MSADTDMGYVDGNAVIGAFTEVFGSDVSVVMLTCAACGAARRFVEAHVYDRGPGIVLRCPQCDEVTARMVRTPSEVWVDLRGVAAWRIPANVVI